MATKVFYFYKRADSAVASWTLTYSSAFDSLVFPAIDAVPKTSGDITTYLDWTRPGYAFMGWDTEEDGTGTRYLPEDSTAIGLAPTNYYAQWVEIQPVVTISYNNNVIFEASSTTGTQVLTTQNSFLTDNITVHYVGGGAATQSVTVTPRTLSQTITPDSGYIGFNPVIVEAISPIKAAATYTPTTANQTIAANQWLGGAQTIKGDANLVAENIKNGVSIFGVAGTYTGGGGGGGDFAGLVQRTLTSVSDSTISYISDYAFYHYSTLTTTLFPSCTTIGDYAFYFCSHLANISFPICTTIGSNAFAYCHSLTTISFPSCTTIGSYAFTSCNYLTTASFPVCTALDIYAFAYCSKVTTASFPVCTEVPDAAFRECISLTNISFPSCTTIGAYAFQSCSSLTTISFPVCTTINGFAFANCINLTTALFPQCITIGSSAFRNCSKLTTVSFPVCRRIQSLAFYNCYSLTTASFPNCSAISNSAFGYCYHLLSLYLLTSSVPTLANVNVFLSTPISNYTTSTGGVHGSIFVKASLLASFQTATRWSTYSARMVGLTDEQIAALG